MRKYLKMMSVFVSMLFVGNTVMAQTSVYNINVPDKIGKVKERYVGTSDSVVVHIQDAHKSSEAQKNIANIIEFLIQKDGLNLVGTEGATGAVDMSDYRAFPFKDIVKKVAFDFVKKGFFTGGEYAQIVSSKAFDFNGLEEENLMITNYKAFLQSVKMREDALAEFGVIDQAVTDLEAAALNEDLKGFLASVKSYENKDVDFIDFSADLIAKAQELKVDLFNFVELSQYTEYLTKKDALDLEAVQKEKEDLLKIFEKRKGELDEDGTYLKLAKATSGENPLFTEKETQEMIIALAVKLSVPEEQFANLKTNVELERRFQLFNIGKLLREADELTYQILNMLAKTDTERKLLEIRRDVKTTLKMITLDSLKSDSSFFAERKGQMDVSAWYAFLDAEGKKINKEWTWNKGKIDYATLFDAVHTYYDAAAKRDDVLSENMVSLMNTKGQKLGAMVTGGYHTEGITEYFRKTGQSYVVVMPRLTSALEDVPLNARLDGSLLGIDVLQLLSSRFQELISQLTTDKTLRTKLVNQYGDSFTQALTAGNRPAIAQVLEDVSSETGNQVNDTGLRATVAALEALVEFARKNNVRTVEELNTLIAASNGEHAIDAGASDIFRAATGLAGFAEMLAKGMNNVNMLYGGQEDGMKQLQWLLYDRTNKNNELEGGLIIDRNGNDVTFNGVGSDSKFSSSTKKAVRELINEPANQARFEGVTAFMVAPGNFMNTGLLNAPDGGKMFVIPSELAAALNATVDANESVSSQLSTAVGMTTFSQLLSTKNNRGVEIGEMQLGDQPLSSRGVQGAARALILGAGVHEMVEAKNPTLAHDEVIKLAESGEYAEFSGLHEIFEALSAYLTSQEIAPQRLLDVANKAGLTVNLDIPQLVDGQVGRIVIPKSTVSEINGSVLYAQLEALNVRQPGLVLFEDANNQAEVQKALNSKGVIVMSIDGTYQENVQSSNGIFVSIPKASILDVDINVSLSLILMQLLNRANDGTYQFYTLDADGIRSLFGDEDILSAISRLIAPAAKSAVAARRVAVFA